MKANNTIFIYLLIQLFLNNYLFAQSWAELNPEPDGVAMKSWKMMRIPTSSGPVKLPSGANAMYFTGPYSAYNSGAIYQTVAFSSNVLRRYRATALVKTKDASGNGASLYAYGKAQDLKIGSSSSVSVSGTEDWTEVSLTFIVDSQMDSVRLGYYMDGQGEAWFKELKWEELPLNNVETKEEVVQYLDTFFQIVSSNALYRERIHWEALRMDADRLTAGAQETGEVHDALFYLLQRVNKHSFLQKPQAAAAWSGAGTETEEPQLVDYPVGRKIDERISYVTVPHLGSGHQPTLVYYADTLQALIASLDSRKTTGWIVDLRGNTGGNCWPMLAGVGPILGNGICGYFMEPDGSNAVQWAYEKGSSFHGDAPRVKVTGKPYQIKQKTARIAVLTDAQTMSSGEVTTLAFRGRPNTRSFGQPTGGYSTTNANFYLPDGAMVLLTVSVYGDRDKNPYGGRITPDEVVEPKEGEDAALAAAIRWLRSGK
ncbi:S41 family peptidase [Neolewinella persica]|uniref:S41 family peptidase n=1 Tax=Neolewinella persica TaxID=70998 RepID=UPI000363286E|nr:S41 family peptidase [Neolewinella persica]